MKGLKDKPWYSLTVSICIGIVLFVVLIKLPNILSSLGTFLGFFSTVFLGAVIAYIINPLAVLFEKKVFCKIKKEKFRTSLSNIVSLIAVLVLLIFLIVIVVPQLVDSIKLFTENFDDYVAGLQNTLAAFGISTAVFDLNEFVSSSSEIIDEIVNYIETNVDTILSTTVNVGSAVGQFIIGLLLSIYFLAEKGKLKSGGKRFLKAICKDNYPKVEHFFIRSNEILNRYIVYNLLDSCIIGIVNAIFMTVSGMPYIGLVSIIIAVTNLIPTFGPVIGAIIGGFVLLLVKPWYAGAFLAFTVLLQLVDGYILKPKLFGDSLGVSGLWILIGIIAGGSMFGVVGILIAIPMVAILHMVYHDYILPALEKI